MSRHPRIAEFLLMAAFASQPVAADDREVLDATAGRNAPLAEWGIAVEAVLKSDFLYNAHGGRERDGTILGNFDLVFEVDTERAGGWRGGTFLVYALGNWNSGGLFSDIAGDLQVTSNIEATEAIRLYEAWYEHRFFADRLSLLAGLHDFNSEFDVIDHGAMFLHSSFGISADIAQRVPSIFPTTALAVRARIQPSEDTYILAAAYDGVPGDPNDSTRTTTKVTNDDGVFAALETGLLHGEPGNGDYYKLGAGAWLHTALIENFDGEFHNRNFGVYLIGEKTLYTETDGAQGLGAFVQFGYADEDRNQIAYYWGAGFRYIGLIPGRNRDEIGVAVASAWNGGEFIRFSEDVVMTPVERTETAVEIAYRIEVVPGLILQPDVQYVINPSMDPSVENALQIGIRLEKFF